MYKNKIIYGLKNIHICKLNDNGTYSAPIKLLGGKSVEVSFDTVLTNIYCDDGVRYSSKRVAKGNGTLQLLGLTSTEKALLMGSDNLTNGFALNSNSNTPSFALLFEQSKGDLGKILNVVYNVRFSPLDISAISTEEEIEEQVFEIDFTCLSKYFDVDEEYFYYTVDTTDEEVSKSIVDNFFIDVQIPKPTVRVIDNSNTDSKYFALSANQGMILNDLNKENEQMINDFDTEINKLETDNSVKFEDLKTILDEIDLFKLTLFENLEG